MFLGLGLFCIKSFDLWRVLGISSGAGGEAGLDKAGQGWWFEKQAGWARAHRMLVGTGW